MSMAYLKMKECQAINIRTGDLYPITMMLKYRVRQYGQRLWRAYFRRSWETPSLRVFGNSLIYGGEHRPRN
jgi:hypothetical protein